MPANNFMVPPFSIEAVADAPVKGIVDDGDAQPGESGDFCEALPGTKRIPVYCQTDLAQGIQGSAAAPDEHGPYTKSQLRHRGWDAPLNKAIIAPCNFTLSMALTLLHILIPVAEGRPVQDTTLNGSLPVKTQGVMDALDLPDERGESFHKSIAELWKKFHDDWVELLKKTADQDLMSWSQCGVLAGALMIVYWICRCCLGRKSKQSFGWTMLTFVVALVIAYFEGESKLSQPKKFIIWMFSFSLSLTYIRPLVASSRFNGIHTILVFSVGLAMAVVLTYFSQTLTFLRSMSLGSSFALCFPTTSYVWRALIIQTKWGDRFDKFIGELDPLDMLEYVGGSILRSVTWIKGNLAPVLGQNGETTDSAPLVGVAIDGADTNAPEGQVNGQEGAGENRRPNVGGERLVGEGVGMNNLTSRRTPY